MPAANRARGKAKSSATAKVGRAHSSGGRGRARSRKAARRARCSSLTASNARLTERRAAVQTLNALAAELDLGPSARVPRRTWDGDAVEQLVRCLEQRSSSQDITERIRAAALRFTQNGGQFSAAVVNPTADAEEAKVPLHKVLKPGFRLCGLAFMLTFHGGAISPETWATFQPWVEERARRHRARAWSACVEESVDGDASAPRRRRRRQKSTLAAPAPQYHLHAYFLWTDGRGVDHRTLDAWYFNEIRPRVDVCRCRRRATGAGPLEAALHGLWYVTLAKLGTINAGTNFHPWRDYVPKATWLLGQYNAHKLTHEQYVELSARFRTGHDDRKRDAAAALADEKRSAVRRHVEVELAALRRDAPLMPARDFQEVRDFLAAFGASRWRRPMLVIVGGTNFGKSFLARDVLRKLAANLGVPGFLEVTVEEDTEPSLENFDHRMHSGVLFDGVADALFLHQHREVLQGQAKEEWGGRSATMKFAYPYTLCRRGVVATFDSSARNLDALATNHWLADNRNVIVLELTSPAWETLLFL